MLRWLCLILYFILSITGTGNLNSGFAVMPFFIPFRAIIGSVQNKRINLELSNFFCCSITLLSMACMFCGIRIQDSKAIGLAFFVTEHPIYFSLNVVSALYAPL